MIRYDSNGKAVVYFDIASSGGDPNRRNQISLSLSDYLAYSKASTTLEELRYFIFTDLDRRKAARSRKVVVPVESEKSIPAIVGET